MYHPIQLTNTIPTVRASISRSPLWRRALLIALALASFAFSPMAQAVDPPPDGGYPGFNTAEGDDALLLLTNGSGNTAIGWETLFNNTTGSDNTATGAFALFSNTTGFNNTATGYEALFGNTTGSFNTASGLNALASNTTGTANTASGSFALIDNTTGNNNTASGDGALFNNTSGDDNTANGVDALLSNTTGANNTASGTSALLSNTTGLNNTALGNSALVANTTASSNTAIGNNALSSNTTGGSNIAVGDSAGSALTTGKNNIDIGHKGVAGESNKIRIGTAGTQKATFIAGITGVTVPGGVGVIVGSDGKLGTVVSSERFKEAMQPMDKSSEAILSLQPVTFRYKHELDPAGIPQFGLVAEQVEKVNPALVARDDAGKPYTVRYEAVNAMLLNEFLKEHRKVEEQTSINQEQQTTIADLKSEIQALTKRFEKQSAQIQKVSDRIQSNRTPSPLADGEQ